MKTYSIPAVAQALGISEQVMEGKKAVTLSDILALSENTKLKTYTEEAEKIRQLIADIKELEK